MPAPAPAPAPTPPHHKPANEHQCPWCTTGTPHPRPIRVHIPKPGP